MRTKVVITTFFLFFVASMGATFAEAQAKKKVTLYSVKTGTVFRVRIESTLSSKSARPGDTFQTTLVDPVYSGGGVVVIPQGSTVNGRGSTRTVSTSPSRR